MQEIKIQAVNWPYREVNTIFFGGGTPSLLTGKDIQDIMDCLRENFNVSDDAEITIEANPNTLTDAKLEGYRTAGINRISIGIQSFDNTVLDFLGRIHNKNEALAAYQRARRAGFDNINIDLMFGIPGQTMKKWTDTVRQAIFLRPQHISLYSLSIEEGTPMYDMLRRNEFNPTPDYFDREMYHEALKMLRGAGYSHYEISNCALPGYEGKHNMKYWSYEEYLGLGLGASSFVGGKRYSNLSKMLEYINAIKVGLAPVDDGTIEDYSERDEMGIYVFTGLRKAEGLRLSEFRKIFGRDFFDIYDRSIVARNKGLLILDEDRLYLTEHGMDVSNRIMAEFV